MKTRICGIPAQVEVTSYSPATPARTWGPPELCYPAEDEEIEIEVLDRRGRPAPWLQRKMSDDDYSEVFRELREMWKEEDRTGVDYQPW